MLLLANTFQSRNCSWFCGSCEANKASRTDLKTTRRVRKLVIFSFYIWCLYHVSIISSFLLLIKYLETYLHILNKYIYIYVLINIFGERCWWTMSDEITVNMLSFRSPFVGWLWVFSFYVVTCWYWYWFWKWVTEDFCQQDRPACKKKKVPVCHTLGLLYLHTDQA